MPRYSELSIDGVVGDVYDKEAIHEIDFPEYLSEALVAPAIKNAILNLCYPVGAYLISSNSANPSTYIGGTWTRVEGRFIIGASSSYPVNTTGGSADLIVPTHRHNASGSTGSAGAHTHTVSGNAASAGAHNHGVGSGRSFVTHNSADWATIGEKSANLPGDDYHVPSIKKNDNWYGSPNTASAGSHTHTVSGSAASAGAHTHSVTVSVDNSGSSGAGKNIPPYVSAYIWRRTA